MLTHVGTESRTSCVDRDTRHGARGGEPQMLCEEGTSGCWEMPAPAWSKRGVMGLGRPLC